MCCGGGECTRGSTAQASLRARGEPNTPPTEPAQARESVLDSGTVDYDTPSIFAPTSFHSSLKTAWHGDHVVHVHEQTLPPRG